LEFFDVSPLEIKPSGQNPFIWICGTFRDRYPVKWYYLMSFLLAIMIFVFLVFHPATYFFHTKTILW
jgi:hypothetical protein